MLSSGQIMQYFKNSICIKGGGTTLRNLTHKFAISTKHPKAAGSNLTCYKKQSTLINFTNYSVEPPQICVWRIIEYQMFEELCPNEFKPQKNRPPIFFTIALASPGAPTPQLIIED